MAATLSTHWFWSDWLGDQEVRRLTPAERGVWIDLLALAAGGSPTGYVCDAKGKPLTLDEIARVTNAGSVDEVAEHIKGILEKGAASRDRAGRLFNRRMVREAEKAAKKTMLSEKRAKAGRIGADHTKDTWLSLKRLRDLPRQMPEQLPQHVPRQSLDNHSIKRNITSTFSEAAREESSESSNTATSLATALPAGALARSPLTESGAKRPHELSRSELDAIIAGRRGRKEAH